MAPRIRLAAPPTELAPGRPGSGEVAVWEYRPSEVSGRRLRTCEVMNQTGQVVRRVDLPRADWRLVAVATELTSVPVGVRAKEEKKYCLSRIHGERYEDFYSPGRRINGVYGSPRGERVAFLEEPRNSVPGARTSLKVIPVRGGHPAVVAADAWPWSHVAWSPDGTKIAYCRATDGRIVIARVPSSH